MGSASATISASPSTADADAPAVFDRPSIARSLPNARHSTPALAHKPLRSTHCGRGGRYHRAVRIVHVINCLSLGGAERQLLRLAAAQQRSGDEATIVTLLDKDTLRADADRAGIPVIPLGLRGGLGLPRTLLALTRTLTRLEPEVVQSWLYWANLATMLALGRSPTRRRFPLAWNIRQTLPEQSRERWSMRQAIRLSARWSRRTNALVYNAETARDQHRSLGYHAPLEVVIPNAIEIEAAPHGATARHAARRSLDLPADARVIAHAARLHPMKDHAGFLHAVAPLLERHRDCVVILFGRDVGAERFREVFDRLPALGVAHAAQRLRFLGERLDLAALLPAADCFVSSSAWGEAFPNVVAEAMAAAVAVVATDVGDARAIVGDAGRIVPARNPLALTDAIESLLALDPAARDELGRTARLRIAERTSIDSVLREYRHLWSSIARPSNEAAN